MVALNNENPSMTKLTIDQALQKGIEAHKAGQVQEADRLYTAILKAQPKHPNANHNMGVLALGIGKVEEALPFLKTALEANPAIAQFWLTYIDALIKLGKLADAKAVFDQAKSKGAKGDGFNKLEQSLKKTGQEPISASKITAEVPPQQSNILDSLNLEQALKLAKKKTKEGSPEKAKRIYQDVLAKFPKNKRAIDGLRGLGSKSVSKASNVQDPPQNQLQFLINLYNKGLLKQALEIAEALALKFPTSATLFNIQGVVFKRLGQIDLAVEAYKKALAIKPDFAEVLNNLGNILRDQDKVDAAIEALKGAVKIQPDFADAYNNLGLALAKKGDLEPAMKAYSKALIIQPDHADAHNNIGNIFKERDEFDKAIGAYTKALTIEPDHAAAYNNLGNAYTDSGKLDDAVAAYIHALEIQPDYADAYNNMGLALKEQGHRDQAIDSFRKTLELKPGHADALRNLSNVAGGNSNKLLIKNVSTLLKDNDLSSIDRCQLLFTFAKMNEDLGDFNAAFHNYVAGGALRRDLLKYQFEHDLHLFSQIKSAAPRIKNIKLNITQKDIIHSPIFIIGMPRSGTTLVEQIVSMHTKVTGAGELKYIEKFGFDLAVGQTPSNAETLRVFRECYLAELSKKAEGLPFITDKMPQNFQYMALICAAFPEAKIVHVRRRAEATCWSNFKHYFTSKGLGYSYDLADTVKYYNLYLKLMHFWYQSYSDRIYNLDYDKLTEDQELETRSLIDYLGLDWQEPCLAPQKNKRFVKTASQQQVREKVYKGSSQHWRKYEPMLSAYFKDLSELV